MRNPRQSKVRLWLFTALLAPFALICLALALFALKAFHDAYLLENDSVTTEARVIEREEKTGRGTSDRVGYVFKVGSEEISGSSSLTKIEFEKLHVGASISVRYVKDNPSISIAASYSPWTDPITLAIAAVLGNLCVWSLLIGLHSGRLSWGGKPF